MALNKEHYETIIATLTETVQKLQFDLAIKQYEIDKLNGKLKEQEEKKK